MSESFGSVHQPTYIHLDSQVIDPHDRNSRISRQSQLNAQTWDYTSQVPSREPPSIVIPTVSVAPSLSRQPAEFGSVEDEEYMTIDIDAPDLEFTRAAENTRVQSPTSTKASSGKRGFVGGFVNSLRRLPKAVRGGRKLRRPLPNRGIVDIAEAGPADVVPPRYSTTDDALRSNVQYVVASQMPIEEPAPPPTSYALPTPLSATAEHPAGSRTSGSRDHSRLVSTTHSFDNGEAVVHHPDSLSNGGVGSHIHSGQVSVSGLHNGPVPVARRGTLTGADASTVDSPVLVNPLPASDYARMDAFSRTTSFRSSRYSVFHIGRFFKDLKELPWISTRITSDYVPGDDRQRRVGKSVKPSSSWYQHPYHHTSLDLLSSGSSGSSASRHSHRTDPVLSGTSHSRRSANPPNTRTHEHRKRRSRSHDALRARYADGHHYPMYPFPYPPYNYSPQPLFVIQPPGSRSDSPSGRQPETQQTAEFPEIRQAMPVYMVSPTPGHLGAEPPRDRAGKHHHHPKIHPFPVFAPGNPPPSQSAM